MDQTKEMSPPSIKVPNWAVCKWHCQPTMGREVYPIQGHVRRAAILVTQQALKNFFPFNRQYINSTWYHSGTNAQKLSAVRGTTPCFLSEGNGIDPHQPSQYLYDGRPTTAPNPREIDCPPPIQATVDGSRYIGLSNSRNVPQNSLPGESHRSPKARIVIE